MKNSATGDALAIVRTILRGSESATAEAVLTLASEEKIGDKTYRSIVPLGLETVEDAKGLVVAVHMHSKNHDGFGGFPFGFKGLTFESTRSDVQAVLGVPESRGQGRLGPWDRFSDSGLLLTFSYSKDATTLVMVTAS